MSDGGPLTDEAVGGILLVISLVLLCSCLVAIVKLLHSLLQVKPVVTAQCKSPLSSCCTSSAGKTRCNSTVQIAIVKLLHSLLQVKPAGTAQCKSRRQYGTLYSSHYGKSQCQLAHENKQTKQKTNNTLITENKSSQCVKLCSIKQAGTP